MQQGSTPDDAVRLNSAEAAALASAVSRRALVGGSVAATIAAILGVDFVGAPAAQAATWNGVPTLTLNQVIDAAMAVPTGSGALDSTQWASGDLSRAWCDRFVNWFLKPNGAPQALGVDTLYAQYQSLGRVGSVARVGALRFNDFTSAPLWEHVGLVTKVVGSSVVTREGNTTPDYETGSETTLSQYGSGTVQTKTRTYSGTCFAYPLYLGYDSMTGVGDPGAPTSTNRTGMTTRFGKIGSGTGGAGTIVALAGDAGFPCAANWQEYSRNPADESYLDRAFWEFKVHGTLVWIPAAQWDALKLAYTTGPILSAPQTVNLSAQDRALLTEISNKLS